MNTTVRARAKFTTFDEFPKQVVPTGICRLRLHLTLMTSLLTPHMMATGEAKRSQRNALHLFQGRRD